MTPAAKPAIIVHGGAGEVDADRLPACRAGCEAAARAGWSRLEAGGSALDAVEAAVRLLEDDPQFNAGHGAVLDRAGNISVDAAIMDGALRAGGVGALLWVRHPVTVARRLLEAGEHVLLVGDGALAFAREQGIAPEAPETLVTARARARFIQEQAGRLAPSATGDTVGACAIDARGHVAAATSTGGISWKRPGRVGDSPIPGAGNYADDSAGAASTTGHGESILRICMAKLAVDRLRAGAGSDEAARAAVDELAARVSGRGGIILVDRGGRFAHARNTGCMPWAAIADGGAESGV
jgi:beta-aspartyl-peptidase (threonine type)